MVILKSQNKITDFLIILAWAFNVVPWSSTLAGTIKQHWWNVSCLLDVLIAGAEGNHCKWTQIVRLRRYNTGLGFNLIVY